MITFQEYKKSILINKLGLPSNYQTNNVEEALLHLAYENYTIGKEACRAGRMDSRGNVDEMPFITFKLD